MVLSAMEKIKYKRNHFSTALPCHFIYTRSHYWIENIEKEFWKVGLTSFATRMLGELVEFEFETRPGSEIQEGVLIGWIEGLKATSDIYAISNGHFVDSNSLIISQPELFHRKPYSDGWLYQFNSDQLPTHMNAREYVSFLDETIDQLSARSG